MGDVESGKECKSGKRTSLGEVLAVSIGLNNIAVDIFAALGGKIGTIQDKKIRKCRNQEKRRMKGAFLSRIQLIQ